MFDLALIIKRRVFFLSAYNAAKQIRTGKLLLYLGIVSKFRF